MADASAALAAQIADAHATQRALEIVGGGSRRFYGNEPRGDPVSTASHSGIVAHEPDELVITARAGTPLTEIEQTLDRSGQWLAFEPPRFGAASTLGGCIASGISGPGRISAGAVRDFVLGVKILDGRGRALRFGGEVMKNVAGFDVSRLLAGSLGTLGVLLEASLKVLPKAATLQTRCFDLASRTAIDAVNRWAAKPMPLSASAWIEGRLHVRLAGSPAGVSAAARVIGGEPVEDVSAAALWASLRDHTHAFFAGGEPLWRVAVPGLAPDLELPGRTLIEWHGGQRWVRTEAPAHEVRSVAALRGGHATLFRASNRSAEAFTRPPAAVFAVHRRLKEAFDPAGILNPGRLYPDL